MVVTETDLNFVLTVYHVIVFTEWRFSLHRIEFHFTESTSHRGYEWLSGGYDWGPGTKTNGPDVLNFRKEPIF